MYKVSVVMAAYQAEDSIRRAIQSILDTPRRKEIEILVVDDCSNDATCEVVRKLQKEHDNIRLCSMPCNSGSPSGPRNLGIEKATGKYITFLDDDDQTNVESFLEMVDQTDNSNADFAKGYLIAIQGEHSNITNRLPQFPKSEKQTIEYFVAYQSMTQDFIVRRSVLVENNLKYRNDLKIGEDTAFISSILIKVEKPIYIDNFFLYYYKTPLNTSNLSSTQRWGDREVLNQIASWKIAEETLCSIGISYYQLRLCAGLRNLLISLVRYSDGISEQTFQQLASFVRETIKYTQNGMNLSIRYQDVYKTILSQDYHAFCKAAKRRLLVAGYDLKFILPVLPYLKNNFEIQVDEWTGHNSHNTAKSKELANWADMIWCEWMLGNAVYYSKLKNNNQRLVIRAHRFEITREFGDQLDWNKVDAVFTVGYYYYERFISRFSIPRAKMRLLSNYVENSIYSSDKAENARYHIGLIGILPKRKGFLRALELLSRLVKKDKRFKLYVMGKTPEETSWIKNNAVENEYYMTCQNFIDSHQLDNHVIYGGFVERKELYNNLGYILSLSDNEQPESFHLAPAEASCAGCMGLLLKWPGVEYIYPPEVLFSSIDEIESEILEASKDDKYYQDRVRLLQNYVMKHYSMKQFLSELESYLLQVRFME